MSRPSTNPLTRLAKALGRTEKEVREALDQWSPQPDWTTTCWPGPRLFRGPSGPNTPGALLYFLLFGEHKPPTHGGKKVCATQNCYRPQHWTFQTRWVAKPSDYRPLPFEQPATSNIIDDLVAAGLDPSSLREKYSDQELAEAIAALTD